MLSQCLSVFFQSWAAQTGKLCNGSDSENWRDRRGSTPSSLPASSSSCSSSSSSSPSSPPSTFSSSTSSFPAFSSVNRSRNDKPCKFYTHLTFLSSRGTHLLMSNFGLVILPLTFLAESFQSSSSYFESVCSSRRASTCSQRSPSPQVTDDLPELLIQLGLIKYISVFEQQEVNKLRVLQSFGECELLKTSVWIFF